MKPEVLKKILSNLAVLSLVLVLSACQSAATNDSGASQSASQKAGSQQAAEVEAPPEVKAPVVVEQPPVVETAVLDDYGNIIGWMRNGEFFANPNYVEPVMVDLTDTKIVYFDLDQSSIKEEYRAVLAAHAAKLAANPSMSLRLEGHADERGSREYNIGLGERRAQAVKRALMLNGVSASALETISFGEEKPAAQGTGEGSWSQNRRVELVVK